MARLRRIGIAIKCEDVSRRIALDDDPIAGNAGDASREKPPSDAAKGPPAGVPTPASLNQPTTGISSA